MNLVDNLENKMVIDSQWPAEPEYVESTIICPLCGKEVPEEELIFAVCERCITRNETWETALAYGAHSKTKVEINALFAKVLSDDQINEALHAAAMNVRREYPALASGYVRETVSDDVDDFAHWLIDQKEE